MTSVSHGSPRSRLTVRVACLFAVALGAGCEGSLTTGSGGDAAMAADAGRGDDAGPDFDGGAGVDAGPDLDAGARTDAAFPPGPVHFPLRVGPTSRTLVDADAHPFLMHGEAAWSLVVELTREDATLYLDDRQMRGVNTLLVNLIEHMFASDAPRNAYGESPFRDTTDFTTTNDAYFDHAEWIVSEAEARGMMVLLAPAYVGYGGGAEGWWVEMSGMPLAICTAYGDYVAGRLAAHPNIVWVEGGDYLPPAGSAGEACALAVTRAIQARIPSSLHTGHWARGSSSRDSVAFTPLLQLDAFYTDETTHPRALDEYARSSPRPTFLIEARYEGEGPDRATFRRQSWWVMTSGASGHVTGNGPIWRFGAGWQAELGSAGSRDMQQLRAALDTDAFATLVPDAAHAVVTGGYGTRGGTGYVTAAAAVDGSLAIAYVPDAASRTLTVDLARFAGAVSASWRDPTDGTTTPVTGSPFAASGTRDFAVPGTNASGARDWLLVLRTGA